MRGEVGEVCWCISHGRRWLVCPSTASSMPPRIHLSGFVMPIKITLKCLPPASVLSDLHVCLGCLGLQGSEGKKICCATGKEPCGRGGLDRVCCDTKSEYCTPGG